MPETRAPIHSAPSAALWGSLGAGSPAGPRDVPTGVTVGVGRLRTGADATDLEQLVVEARQLAKAGFVWTVPDLTVRPHDPCGADVKIGSRQQVHATVIDGYVLDGSCPDDDTDWLAWLETGVLDHLQVGGFIQADILALPPFCAAEFTGTSTVPRWTGDRCDPDLRDGGCAGLAWLPGVVGQVGFRPYGAAILVEDATTVWRDVRSNTEDRVRHVWAVVWWTEPEVPSPVVPVSNTTGVSAVVVCDSTGAPMLTVLEVDDNGNRVVDYVLLDGVTAATPVLPISRCPGFDVEGDLQCWQDVPAGPVVQRVQTRVYSDGVLVSTVFTDPVTGTVIAAPPAGAVVVECPSPGIGLLSGGVSVASGVFASTLGPDGVSWAAPGGLRSVTVRARKSNTSDATVAAGNRVQVTTNAGTFVLLTNESFTWSVDDPDVLGFVTVETFGDAAAAVEWVAA